MKDWVVAVVAVIVAIAVNVAGVMIGEPTHVWLYCEMFAWCTP